jgi:hypothetical protein
MRTLIRKSFCAILVPLIIFQGTMAYAGKTTAVAVGGVVRELPPKKGKTLPAWPVGAYTDKRLIPEARLASGQTDRDGNYNLQADNVDSNLEELWILSEASEGQAPPVPVGLHPPMEPRYACTAGELIVSYGTKALAETNAAISYTSAAILDQAVRVFLNLLNEKEAKDNLRNIAGLVVVKEYQRPDSYPYDNFWKNVTHTVLTIVFDEYKRNVEIGSIASRLREDLRRRTLDNPNPSSY